MPTAPLIAKQTWRIMLIAGAMLCCLNISAQEQDQKLQDLQEQIKQKQKLIESNLATAKNLQIQLKKQELDIATSAKKLANTQRLLKENSQRQQELTEKQTTLKKKLAQQEDVLAKQLRSAYMAGNHDYAKMIFNLQSASKFERMLTYYQYLNAERQQHIDEFRQVGVELQKVETELLAKQKQLEQLKSSQQQQQQALARQQQSRQVTLASLNKKIDSEAAQVEQLQINEQTLLQALQAAQEEAQRRQSDSREVMLTGLGKFKGHLQPPVKGNMRKLFGARRQGQVRWKGVLIYSDEGESVQAVQDAQVLYADWLKGFGLVIALDHGEGYMSLYGHNQALLKDVGEKVQQGESIALVGQSGGQSRPGLYFEIRHKGKPVNPSRWLSR